MKEYNFFMKKHILIPSLLVWILFIPIVILNGAIRNFLYKPLVGELLAHQISSFTASFAFIIFSYFLLKDKLDSNTKELFLIGFLWVGLTVLFEFGFGHYIMGNSWEKLFHDYNIFQGRIWILVLLTELTTPFVIKKLAKT